MKNKTMRTAAVLMTAALAATSLCGCSKDGGSGSGFLGGGAGKKNALDVSFDYSYAGEKLSFEGAENINDGISFGDKYLFVGYNEDYTSQRVYIYDPATQKTETKEFAYLQQFSKEKNASAYTNSYFMDNDGNFEVLFNGYTWSTNEDGEDEYEDLGMTLEIYDKDFNVISTTSLKDKFDEDSSFNYIVANPAGGYLATMWDYSTDSQGIFAFDKDFNKTGDIKANFQYIENLYTSKDGNVYVLYEDGEGMEKFGSVNAAAGSVTPIDIDGIPSWVRGCFACADGSYDLFMYDSEYIYGVNVKSGKCEPVLNWINSDFLSSYINMVTQLPDGRFMVSNSVRNGSEFSDSEFWMLSPRPADAFKDVTMISMAGLYFQDDITEAVLSYNRTHDDTRIALVSYEKYSTEEDPDGALKKLQTDMTSGIVADLILTMGLPYESFANKGLFMDLTDRAYSSFPASDYFTNVFDSLKYGDKLYQIGASYSIETLVGRQDIVGTKSGLTTAEFMQLIKDLPASASAFGDMTKSDASYGLISMNIRNFVDVGAGTCSFNSPEFVQLLELCNTFPTDEEIQKRAETNEHYWEDAQYNYINGKTAFATLWINDVRSAYEEQLSNFDKAKVTRVGFPVSGSGGNGGRFNMYSCLAISANSDKQDQCWEFISSLFTEEAQENLSWMMPVSRKAFDKRCEEAMKPRTYKDETGKMVEEQFTIWRGDEEIKYPNMPQSFADELKTYIEGIRDPYTYDATIMEIINEEGAKYFAGEQTSQQAADMIQSRASLYLSEQK